MARVKPYNPESGGLAHCRSVWLRRTDDREPTRFEVLARRSHKRLFLIALDGIDSLDALEPWRGSEVSVDRGDLPVPREGEVYHYEVIGLAVRTSGGDELGVVREVLPLPANDVWVVEATRGGRSREILIPVVGAIVKEIDLAHGCAWIEAPPGLLEE